MTWTWQRPTTLSDKGWETARQSCQHSGLLLDRFAPNESFDTEKRN
jgi:hypothetical protein